MEKISIHDVLASTFRIYGRTFIVLTIFLFVALLAPVVILFLVMASMAFVPIEIVLSLQSLDFGQLSVPVRIVGTIVSIAVFILIASMFLVGFLGVVHGGVRSMDDVRPTFGSCLSAGLSSCIKGVLAYILVTLIVISMQIIYIYI